MTSNVVGSTARAVAELEDVYRPLPFLRMFRQPQIFLILLPISLYIDLALNYTVSFVAMVAF